MQKHQLIIMRHAKSDWSEGNGSDFERPLTARGKKAAKQMGKWLKHRYRIDRIICSPALRTKQTCQLVAEQLRLSQNHIRWESAIYDASLNDLVSVIKKYSENIRTLLLIGHNPGLDQLLCYLSRDPPPVTSMGKLLTTAAIAVLDYGDTGITVQPNYACLQCLVRPKELS
ncbi:phosphohistidine phosphatase SixA [Nitrosomonas sp. Nm84]|uniref:SixA phosphatase family protein n=1 Tax=Nitrosomonas sp. Nm84 TaxID=200124 RepID=UPI000D768706|nr:histidine phosphatase family protein [Nitrosomonas sp. Nm84]PXW82561.1 phosphohistidine phosphatase SixA [Nitrosomonas sp. Nm84]